MYADLVLLNGRIYTVNPKQPWAQAIACQNGRLVAIGTSEEIHALIGPHTNCIDVEGRLVLPGFIDSHIHFLQYATRRHQLSLFGLDNFAEVQQRLQTAVAQADPGQWIMGWGWDETSWDITPVAAYLDDIAPQNPVALVRMDMHSWWVNSLVLQQANITADTPDPVQSQIDRDTNGHPTGILREWNAIALVEAILPPTNDATLLKWLKAAQAEVHQWGLTGIHDQRVEGDGPLSLRLYQILNGRRELTLRIHANIAADYLPQVITLGLQPGFGDDRLWLGHVKTFADGSMGSRTAWMLAPYEGEPHNHGIQVMTTNALWQLTHQASQAGFSLSVHAIGDRAVREVLDVFDEHQASHLAMPHRIEHIQLIHPHDLDRLKHANIVGAVQPVHLYTDWSAADHVWGDRARYAYAFRSIIDQGTQLAFGSDAPVAPINPMLGLHAAVTRQDARGQPTHGWYPQERLSMAEAIAAYTMGPAYLAGKQQVQGSLAVGKWADMIVLSQDLFTIPVDAIPSVNVDLTIFAGKIVYKR